MSVDPKPEVEDKCVRPGCGLEATYCSPERLCDEHWAIWWVDGLEPKTDEERATLMVETLDAMRQGKEAAPSWLDLPKSKENVVE